jgi:MFS family permease
MNKFEIEEQNRKQKEKSMADKNAEAEANIQDDSEERSTGCRSYQGLIAIIALCSMNLLNNSDRYILSSVLTDIEDFFSISKSTAGLLQTVYLACYMLASPFAGYLGDRIDRKWLLVAGLLVWGTSTILGSLCGKEQFVLFVASRCLFGIATGIFGPVGVPILGDRFANNEVRFKYLIKVLFLNFELETD